MLLKHLDVIMFYMFNIWVIYQDITGHPFMHKGHRWWLWQDAEMPKLGASKLTLAKNPHC